jgi:transcriptional regulator with XRE-family HTH domain
MKLRDFMHKKGLTERAFAKSLGTSQQHLNFIIQGKRNPSLELARIIESETRGEVSISELFNPSAPSRLKSRRKKKTIEEIKT